MECEEGNHEKEDHESSSHSSPQEHKSFAEFAKDKLDSGRYCPFFTNILLLSLLFFLIIQN